MRHFSLTIALVVALVASGCFDASTNQSTPASRGLGKTSVPTPASTTAKPSANTDTADLGPPPRVVTGATTK